MTDTTKLDALIVRNIADIEAAYNRAGNEIETVLGKETAGVFEKKSSELGWEGECENSLHEGEQWIAPIEWKMADTESDEYDLFVSMSYHVGLNNYEASWLAHFAGVNGAGVQLALTSNTLKKKQWQSLLKSTVGLSVITALREKGFTVEPKDEAPFALPVKFNHLTLAKAFEDEDFDDAFIPLEKAIDTIASLRGVLDELVVAIRANE